MLAPSMLNTSASEPLSTAWVERLFKRLSAMYGNRFADMWGSVDAGEMKSTWADALAGLTGVEIRAGLDACKTQKWPPTLPEFLLLCRPQPSADPETAFYIAADQMVRRHAGQPEQWPSPRHFWAAQRVGGDMQHLSWRDLAGRWRAAWEQAAADVSRPIPAAAPPEQSLPAPGRTTRNEADVSRMLSEARDQVLAPRASKYPAGVDLSWTEKINDAPRNWPTISCRYAAEARAKFNLPVSDALRKFLGTPQEVAA